tara:strand:+ start:4094 stop:4477 length:384 start_codon:yes stop_codon:yes gene_type:complete
MFDFLKKKQENDQQETNQEDESQQDVIAEITYKIGSDNIVYIDVNVEDYDIDTVQSLCKILDILSEDYAYIQTLETLKRGFTEVGAKDALDLIYEHIGKQVSQKVVNNVKEFMKEQPCIKPSQMLNR